MAAPRIIRTKVDELEAALTPIRRAHANRLRRKKDWKPLRRARALSRRARRGRRVRKPEVCHPTPPASRDAITGWFMYNCPGGVLLVPAPRCVGPECRGAKAGGTRMLGYGGDLDQGSRGAFFQAGRLVGITALDGVEIAKGLSQIDQLQRQGSIDGYYAAAAKNAYLGQLEEVPGREAPFEEVTPFGRSLAPRALGRAFRSSSGEDVGPSVREACNCTPRPFDAIDPISGWGIYYVKGGVLLTPSEKCIAGSARPLRFWEQTWRNVVSLWKPEPPLPTRVRQMPLPLKPPPSPLEPVPPPPPPPPPGGYLCLDPRVVPMFYRPQPTPCVPPQIPYP